MQDRIQKDLKQAQLQRYEIKVSTLRLLLSEIHNLEIQKNGEISDADLVQVIQREVKKRKEAADSFRTGGREEAALKEEAEGKILETYLPAQVSTEELTQVVEQTIKEVGAVSVADMGRVMSAVMGKVASKADGGAVSALVREKLAG